MRKRSTDRRGSAGQRYKARERRPINSDTRLAPINALSERVDSCRISTRSAYYQQSPEYGARKTDPLEYQDLVRNNNALLAVTKRKGLLANLQWSKDQTNTSDRKAGCTVVFWIRSANEPSTRPVQ